MSFTAFEPIYKAAAALLPPKLDTLNAKAIIFTIGMQESHFEERRQIGGPARSFWQFELGGIRGVLNHPASKPIILNVLNCLDYGYSAEISYVAIEHNDVLAFAYARCLLWTLPNPLPDRANPEAGWNQYIAAWRPGKPHRQTWDAFYEKAWEMVSPSL